MATLYTDLDFDDLDWSEYEKREIAKNLYDLGYLEVVKLDDATKQLDESVDSRSYSEIELFKLIQSLIANKHFITSDQIKRIREIIN